MCGIAGFIDPTVAPAVRLRAVASMCGAMTHRGPDSSGTTENASATLGMRRLAIFDPAHGHQPMLSPDGRFTVVFNGAIYNFRDLRSDLEASGWAFRTECDTEVLLAAFARWGEQCLNRLRGMFAFAVWDARERSLFLARDAFGIKPLYFRHSATAFLFASELNALLASGFVAAEIDPVSAGEYLAWQSVPAPRTIYREIFSLRSGECATLRDGHLTFSTWWHFPANNTADRHACRTADEFTRTLRAKLEDTIAAHSLADVPVGAFLSGGLDSAAIVGLMARHAKGPLKTFSIGFDEPGYSEADAAAATAKFVGTDHRETVLRGTDVASDIERIVASLDHPTGDGINTYYVSRAARAGGVTVALSGLGGDELFGGYPSFRQVPRLAPWLNVWRLVTPDVGRTLSSPLAFAGVRGEKLADLIATARDCHALAAQQRRVLSQRQCRRLLDATLAPAMHPQLELLRRDVDPTDLFALTSAWELRGYMADLLLRDSDAMSMAHSLELRVPFVDRPFIEWLWRQPSVFKHTPSHPKSALAAAVGDVIPPELRTRAKRGFTLPFAIWMRRELRPWLRETLSDATVGRTGLLDPGAVNAMSASFFAGRDDRAWSRVWSTAMLVAFINRATPRAALAA